MDAYELQQHDSGGSGVGGFFGGMALYDFLYYQRFDPVGTVYPLTGLAVGAASIFYPKARNMPFIEFGPYSKQTIEALKKGSVAWAKAEGEVLGGRFGFQKGTTLSKIEGAVDDKAVKAMMRGRLRRLFSTEWLFGTTTKDVVIRRAEQAIAARVTYAAGTTKILGKRLGGATNIFGLGFFGNTLWRQRSGVKNALTAAATAAGTPVDAALIRSATSRLGGMAAARSLLGVIGWAWMAYDVGKAAVHGVQAAIESDQYATLTGGSTSFSSEVGLAVAGDFTGGRLMTERRRALQAIGNSRINARSTIGMEAAMIHS